MGPPNPLLFLWLVPPLALATWTDLRSRRIPNTLTYPTIVVGLLWNALVPGALGATDSLLGFAAGFGAMTMGFLVGGVGGGDVKLMGAVGAWLGLAATLCVIFYALCLSVAVAIVLLAVRGGLVRALKDSVLSLVGGSRPAGQPRGPLVPFAAMIALAVAFHYCDLRLSWGVLG